MMLLQPHNDWVENHRQKKDEGEKQDNRLKRAQNKPRDDQQKDDPNEPTRAAITQWSMLIFVPGLFHEMRKLSIFARAARNDKQGCDRTRTPAKSVHLRCLFFFPMHRRLLIFLTAFLVTGTILLRSAPSS